MPGFSHLWLQAVHGRLPPPGHMIMHCRGGEYDSAGCTTADTTDRKLRVDGVVRLEMGLTLGTKIIVCGHVEPP